MIRTRNFLIYMSVFVFLVSAISYTVAHDIRIARGAIGGSQVAFVSAATAPGTIQKDQTTDRTAYITAMQRKIARGEGSIPGSPIVLFSSDASSTKNAQELNEQRYVSWCGTVDDAATTWPTNNVAVETVEGARMVVHHDDVSTTPLLQLPIRQVRAANDSCLPDRVIGVTTAGLPLHNETAALYRAATASTLIGYALDGFPIYGAGDLALDSCGGTDTGYGYRYHLRDDESFILACFAAMPASFIR